MNTEVKTLLIDVVRLTKFYNKEIILFLMILCLVCFIKIYIEFIKTEKRLTKKAKQLQHLEKIRTQKAKSKKIISMLETF
jgi:hypothetical protein